MTKLTPTMRECLRMIRDNGEGVAERWKGGFWTYRGCPEYVDRKSYRVPATWWSTNTIHALIARGLLERREFTIAVVTDAGREAVSQT